MKYRLQFNDVRDGGFLITRYSDYDCDADAMMDARSRLLARFYCDRVDVFRMASVGTCGPITFIVAYEK